MADNPQVRAGTAGGTITVVGDEVVSPYTGDTAIAQAIKILDGLADSTTPARVTSNNELLTFQGNSGTVSVTGTPNVHMTNAATVTLTGTNPVTLLNNGTVIQGTNPWIVTANGGTILGQDGTVAVRGTPNVHQTNNGTVVQGTDPWLVNAWVNTASTVVQSTNPWQVRSWQVDAGTVIQGTNPWIVTANGGTILGQDGTVAVRGNVWVGNNGTVSVSSIAAGDNNIGNVDVVSVIPGTGSTNLGKAEDDAHNSGDVGVMGLAVRKNEPASVGSEGDYVPLIADSTGALWNHVNDGTVALKGNVHVGNNGTVTLTGTSPVFVTNNGTVIQGTNPWIVTANGGTILGQDGTVAVRGNVWVGNNGTVSVSSIAAGDNNIGNVDIVTLPGGITGFAEDAQHTTGDVGIPAMAVRKNEAAALAGADADYTPLTSDALGAVWAHVNDGTVALKGNVHVGNNGTVTLTGTSPVFVTNNGTVNGGTLLGHMGTVFANLHNTGTVTLTGTNPTFQTNNGTVSVSSLPGGITGFAEDAGHTTGDVGIMSLAVRKNEPAAIAGSDADYTPLTSDAVGAAWAHVNDGTVAIKGNVWLGNLGTVTLSGTNPVFQTNNGTIVATDLDIRDLAFTQDSIKKGSATIGLGYTLGGTNILLTASGTVVPSVSSRVLYVTHEAFTVQGGTVTITARNGDGGGTLWGPMQFSPTGGVAASLPIEDGALYETASGSAVYYVLAGSGTVGGRIRWARLAS